MKSFLVIDGDDVGRKITAFYLRNDAAGLQQFSERLNKCTSAMASLLAAHRWDVVFCAADGVTAYCMDCEDVSGVFREIRALSSDGLTFSAGVGNSLRQAYMALLAAKSNGKNQLYVFGDLPDTE